MSVKKHIPNAITCCNLLCGCLAIVQAFEGNLVNAAYLVGLAAIFDFFDGFAARLLKVSSPIGKDLDSLADMVTFGVVPGIVMFEMINFNSLDKYIEYQDYYNNCIIKGSQATLYISYLAFLIPIFSAIRLAKFNHDTRQTTSFIGLPTPANAIFILSLAMIDMIFFVPFSSIGINDENYQLVTFFKLLFNPIALGIISIIMSALLLAELPLFALKFRNFSWRGNRIRYTFLALSLVLLINLQFVGIPLIIVLYVVMSVITNLYIKKRNPLA